MKDKVSVPDDKQDATLARDCLPLNSFNERKTSLHTNSALLRAKGSQQYRASTEPEVTNTCWQSMHPS